MVICNTPPAQQHATVFLAITAQILFILDFCFVSVIPMITLNRLRDFDQLISFYCRLFVYKEIEELALPRWFSVYFIRVSVSTRTQVSLF